MTIVIGLCYNCAQNKIGNAEPFADLLKLWLTVENGWLCSAVVAFVVQHMLHDAEHPCNMIA